MGKFWAVLVNPKMIITCFSELCDGLNKNDYCNNHSCCSKYSSTKSNVYSSDCGRSVKICLTKDHGETWLQLSNFNFVEFCQITTIHIQTS